MEDNETTLECLQDRLTQVRKQKSDLEKFLSGDLISQAHFQTMLKLIKMENNSEISENDDLNDYSVKEKIIRVFQNLNHSKLEEKEMKLNQVQKKLEVFLALHHDYHELLKNLDLKKKMSLLVKIEENMGELPEDVKLTINLRKWMKGVEGEIFTKFEYDFFHVCFYGNEEKASFLLNFKKLNEFFEGIPLKYEAKLKSLFSKLFTNFFCSKLIIKTQPFSFASFELFQLNSEEIQIKFENFERQEDDDVNFLKKFINFTRDSEMNFLNLISYLNFEFSFQPKIILDQIKIDFFSKLSVSVHEERLRREIYEEVKKIEDFASFAEIFQNAHFDDVLEEVKTYILSFKNEFYNEIKKILNDDNLNYTQLILILNDFLDKLWKKEAFLKENDLIYKLYQESLELVVQMILLFCKEKENKNSQFYNAILSMLKTFQNSAIKLWNAHNRKGNVKKKISQIINLISSLERNYLTKFMN